MDDYRETEAFLHRENLSKMLLARQNVGCNTLHFLELLRFFLFK